MPQAEATTPAASCAPQDDTHMQHLVLYLKNLVSAPRAAAARASLSIPAAREADVRPIADEHLCARADSLIAPINRGEAERIYLVRIGSLYWAERPEKRSPHSEYLQAFVLDSTLSGIVSRAGR